MGFKRSPQTFSAKVNAVTIGTGEKAVTIGGENVFPLYSFDAPIENKPKIGVQISDRGYNNAVAGIAEYYKGAENFVDMAKKAALMPGADFLVLSFESANPDAENTSVEECAALAKEIAEAVDMPIVVEGCKNKEKDAKLFDKIAAALEGKNSLFLSAQEENYKEIAASAGLAYKHKVGAESAVDINLAKQLNVLINQMGVAGENIVMNLGSAAAGYGFEYVASTMDRVRSAALSQNDTMLQMPVITPVSDEAWSVKESIVSQEEFPQWGSMEQRGVSMEISTAAACLAAGSNAVILRHPESIATISKLISAMCDKEGN